MQKNFELWNQLKQHIHEAEKKSPYFHEREVWYIHLGENVGFEQNGKGSDFLRPVVILKKFNNDIFWAIPLTSAEKDGQYYAYARFGQNNSSMAIISQIRLIDAKRLSYKIGNVAKNDFTLIKQKIKELLP